MEAKSIPRLYTKARNELDNRFNQSEILPTFSDKVTLGFDNTQLFCKFVINGIVFGEIVKA